MAENPKEKKEIFFEDAFQISVWKINYAIGIFQFLVIGGWFLTLLRQPFDDLDSYTSEVRGFWNGYTADICVVSKQFLKIGLLQKKL